MARKQRVDAQLAVDPSQAVEICRQALLERGCQIEVVTERHIKARAPGSLTRKYVAYELELTAAADGTTVQIATWTSMLSAV